MAILNSNPEVVLRKRKNADQQRLQKQQEAKKRDLEKRKKPDLRTTNFIRAETLISNYKSNELENKRIAHITKFEAQNSTRKNPRKVEEQLLFVIRVPNHTKGLIIPEKPAQVLKLLRLEKPNTGVFVKQTKLTYPLLRMVSPYIVTGKPSLASVRQLFQKRATISESQEEGEPLSVKLDNNQAVEDQFGDDLGFICIEDLVHELVSLGESFKKVSYWLNPFEMNAPVTGWKPEARLARAENEKESKKKVSLAGNAPLVEIDIDDVIAKQN